MNPFRAKQIADYFSSVGTFDLANKLHGIIVSHQGNQAYFDKEAELWAFLFHLAQARHQGFIVAEAEAKLIA